MPPRVSVVLPYRNAEATLDRAVASVVRQRLSDWELILVDNASTDRSATLARRWRQQDPRVRGVAEPRVGLVYALNTGLRHVTAPVVARMDADDVSDPERLAQQWDHLERHPNTGAVGCRVRYCTDGVARAGMQAYVDWTNDQLTSEQIARSRFVESPLVHPSMAFRTSLLRQYGVYRHGSFPEDYELWLRWLRQGVVIDKCLEVLLDWYDADDRLSRTHERYHPDAFYRIKTQYLATWLAHHNPFHPQVVVWGGGRKSRQRAHLLSEYGVSVRAVIDVKVNKTTTLPCIFYRDVAPPGQYFVLSYVGNRGRRGEIRRFLEERGYREGVDFLLVA